jgi:hypothetical protein
LKEGLVGVPLSIFDQLDKSNNNTDGGIGTEDFPEMLQCIEAKYQARAIKV